MLNKQFFETRGFILPKGHGWKKLTEKAKATLMAVDAQPQLETSPNAGILSLFTTWVDPKIIEVLFSPLEAVAVAGNERKMGDWLTNTVAFNFVERTGVVSTYGDYSEDGVSKANVNYPQRQPYNYQVMTQWGIQEMERMGLAKVDWVSQLNEASIWTLNNFQNLSYFFGVAGLQNYGLLNDPSLPAPIAPLGVFPNIVWQNKDALGIYNDIVYLAKTLIAQGGGLVNTKTRMTMALSPTSEAELAKATQFNVSVSDLITKNYPNLTIVTAPQFSTTAGELVRLKADLMDGQLTEEVSFTEKLRSFSVINYPSSYVQKKMQGTNGAIIYRPVLIASMLGV
jgi:hypothetical protein